MDKFNHYRDKSANALSSQSLPHPLPARLNSELTARFLGFSLNDIAPLVSVGLLVPLGKPVPNSTKYFATRYLQELSQDLKWLDEATQAAYDYWKTKNARKSQKTEFAE